MDIEALRRIYLARHLYELGLANITSANDLYLFSGVNLLQDAVEAFLIAVADCMGVTLDERTNFDRYFELINEKIKPKELPFKNKLLRLNKIRISSKHHGIQPPREECQRLTVTVGDFFDEISSTILNVNFATVSAIDLLKEGEAKRVLLEAKASLDKGELQECAIFCRKAIYLELEHEYDISYYKDKKNPPPLIAAFSKAPSFSKNSKYIDENVKEPTDYIVYDFATLEQELLMYGIDNAAFWNICRLTPKVYQTKDEEWIVKNELDKLETNILKDNIEYIFNTTIDIILAIHTKRASVKRLPDKKTSLELNQEEVPIFEKADKTSKIVATTPKGLTRLDYDYYITGLQDEGPYWHVSDFNHMPDYYYGFIHNDYVK
jgi:hypothetical protein